MWFEETLSRLYINCINKDIHDDAVTSRRVDSHKVLLPDRPPQKNIKRTDLVLQVVGLRGIALVGKNVEWFYEGMASRIYSVYHAKAYRQ